MALKAHSNKGLPPSRARFFRGIPWDPPRANMRPATWGLGFVMIEGYEDVALSDNLNVLMTVRDEDF